MLKNINISTKISLIILGIGLVAVGSISFFSFDHHLKTAKEKTANNLHLIAENQSATLSVFFEKNKLAISHIQASPQIQSPAPSSPDPFGAPDTASLGENTSLDTFLESQQAQFGFESVYILTATGKIVHSSDPFLLSKNFLDPDGTMFSKSLEEVYYGPIYKEKGKYIGYIGAPVSLPSGEHILLIRADMSALFKTIQAIPGLGKTGEVILARQDPSKKVHLFSPLRNEKDSTIKSFAMDDPSVKVLDKVFQGDAFQGFTTDYRKKDVYMVAKPVGLAQWVLMAKMDKEEALGDAPGLMTTFFYAGLCVLALALLLSMVLTRSMTRPLHHMRNTLNAVAQGALPEKNGMVNSRDEFGQMTEKVFDLVDILKNHAAFAKRIGEGKYDTAFKPASENDVLGLSLIEMRNNLKDNEQQDNERNWIIRGVAEISGILRSTDSLDLLGEEVIKFFIEKIGAVQGAFYVVNTDNEPSVIEMKSCFAYGRKKYLQRQFRFAEGLVGQAVAEKDIVLRTEIPDDYVSITSGILGEKRPSCILIAPLIANEEVYGVIEFAGFKKFDSSQVKFVHELSQILARTIFNIKVNERTRQLLAESQEMSNELKEKQEVLRQNAEEMRATQEELERTNQRLEEQIQEVNHTQKRMQLLLENASEVITIYEEDGSIRYISPSVESILGYRQKEMIGNSDFDKVHAAYRDVFRGMFRKMKEVPDEKVTVQFEYQAKEGHYIWIEASGTNFMSNPAIHGYILNSRDITEKRRAEQEQRMRSKMQALSENSPDLITRLEYDNISYINPVIETYTGKEPSFYLNKKIKETELSRGVLDAWLEIVEQVNSSNDKVSKEMEFPSEMGQRVMQVNAIPEYNENEKLESVLLVSHDITERKIIELEIQNKNKKITESINYAKRIQNAILPNSRVINRALPDSFILYKPRDVVSGDFPWYIQIKDDIFIAAVDCTGHGVPGALLSLIGYFLLNDIVRSRKITEPGKILDLLDEGVTRTLRQDEDTTTKDGMDIALCKINLVEGTVEYAGAHRPLYVVKGGVLDEVKGNKFPIGGGIFKNQTNFTNTKISIQKGDSIYFSSDGFPDQFGGPEGRKFGSKKVREIVERAHPLSMNDAQDVFDHEWENWRGSFKQTDDVLLIGIKF